jgi:hypothetical protein
MLMGLGDGPNQVFVCLRVITEIKNGQLVMISFYSAKYNRAHVIRDAIAESQELLPGRGRTRIALPKPKKCSSKGALCVPSAVNDFFVCTQVVDSMSLAPRCLHWTQQKIQASCTCFMWVCWCVDCVVALVLEAASPCWKAEYSQPSPLELFCAIHD